MTPAVSKREARKQDRRAAILCIAKRHFMEHGYAAVSMSAIAAELGGSKGTLWSYFSSKEDLFTATIDEATKSYREQLTALLRPSDDLRGTLTAFARSLIRKVTSREAVQLHRVIASEAAWSPELGKIFYRRGPLRTRELLAELLADAMDKGQLRRADPLRASFVLCSLCASDVHQRAVLGCAFSDADIDGEADYIVDIFMRAFGPETSDPA